MLEFLADSSPRVLSYTTWSIESKWFFMHLIATYFDVFIDCAFSTSENVPSPIFAISLYSTLSSPYSAFILLNLIKPISDFLLPTQPSQQIHRPFQLRL